MSKRHLQSMIGSGTRRWLLLGAMTWLWLMMASPLRAADERLLETGHLRLTLVSGALGHWSDPPSEVDVHVDVTMRDGRIESEAWGHAMTYGDDGWYLRSMDKTDHHGRVLEAATDGRRIRLTVSMDFMGSGSPGHGMTLTRLARYEIQVERQGNGFEGTFKGVYDGKEVSGAVRGAITPIRWRAVEGHEAVKPGEHPRLIFRKSELETIRDRARNTPEGRAIVAQLERRLTADPQWGNPRTPPRWAAGHGVMYQLTGDRVHADRARAMIERILDGAGQNPRMLQRAPRVMGVALAYDLCYDGWDETFRRRVANWLYEASKDVLALGGGGGLNDHPHSNWMGLAYSSAGVAAMAILHDPIDYADPPTEPRMVRVSPLDNTEHADGVPITTLESDVMPRAWLWAGPFPTQDDVDFLEGVGGRDKVHPRPGTQVRHGDITRTFKPSTEVKDQMLWQHDHFTGAQPALDLLVPIDRAYFTTSYYYTVIRNPEAGWFHVRSRTNAGGEDATFWINGERVEPGDTMHLQRGDYGVMIEIAVGTTTPWGRILMQPRFAAIKQDDATASHQRRLTWHRELYARWQTGHDAWLAAERTAVHAQHLIDRAERGVERYLSVSTGDRSFSLEGEGYFRMTLTLGLGPFLHAQKVTLGRQYIEGYGQEWILPLAVITGIGPEGTRPAFGPGGWANLNQQEERSGAFAVCLSSVSPEHLPAVKWWFDRTFGLKGNGTFNIMLPDHAGFILRNYPFDVEARNPGQVLPRAVGDSVQGYYAFRKQWGETDEGHADENDLLAVCYLKSMHRRYVHQAANEPTVRIVGFGQQWASIGKVRIPDAHNFYGGHATDVHLDPKTGSGAVTADISKAYWMNVEGERRPQDRGIRATRAFAVDYSQRSGAAGLYVLIDHVRGGGAKNWQMPYSGEMRIEGNRFTLERGEHRLTGVFIEPQAVQLAADRRDLTATGGDRFTVVLMLTKGAAPQVIERDGTITTVTVGGQTIRIDADDRIRFAH